MQDTMVQNLFAALGFLLLFQADLSASRGKSAGNIRWIKRIGYVFVGFSMALLALAPNLDWPLPSSESFNFVPAVPVPPAMPIPPAIFFAGIPVAIISMYLLVKTVFLELSKKGSHPGELITEGSYGLCRHPGFWWFSLLILDLAVMRGLGEFTIYAATLIFLNFMLILLQDAYLFPKIFEGYDDYKKRVPFLFPRKNKTCCSGE